MASPVNYQSLDAAASAGAGDQTQMKGHYHLTLFVVARNLDAANDTLEVSAEGSPTGEVWADAGTTVAAADFSEDPANPGVYTASITLTGTYYDFVRARVADFADAADGDLEVDAWLMAAGRDSAGQRGNPERGPR